MEESNLQKIRVEKLSKIKEKGVNPYPYRFNKAQTAQKITEEGEGKIVKTAGRLVSIRPHGKSTFADLVDQSGKIQLFFELAVLGEEKYDFLNNLDIGDIIGVEGEIFKTVAGQLTVRVQQFEILSKALLPLPSSWYGLKDVEERYRKRYLDLILNPDVRKVFEVRAKIIADVRKFLNEKGFLEVETPTLQPLYGGANARPFKTHHNALDHDFYLKISDELYLKRLIVGGFEKVFEIDHDFRNEGIDKTHNPEFTMMECYASYWDYKDMMELTEDLYCFVAEEVLGTTRINYQGKEIDIKKPWQRLTMKDAIKKYLKIDVDALSDSQLKEEIVKRGIKYEGEPALTGVGEGFKRGIAIATLFEAVEQYLIEPVFITDFPAETSALCKIHRKDSKLIERFEPYINGWEVGNGYSELNDPLAQKKAFEEQVKARKSGDEEAMPMDEDFVEALEYGMPPTGGLGIGIDRMVMILTNSKSVKDVILFPLLKPEAKNK